VGRVPLSHPAPQSEPGPRLPRRRRRRRFAEKGRAEPPALRPRAGKDGEAGGRRSRSRRRRHRFHVRRGRAGARDRPRRGPVERCRRPPGSAAPGDDPRGGRGAGREGRWVSARRPAAAVTALAEAAAGCDPVGWVGGNEGCVGSGAKSRPQPATCSWGASRGAGRPEVLCGPQSFPALLSLPFPNFPTCLCSSHLARYVGGACS
jgi:hypothetical protein